MDELWCVHVNGPDDVHAAPSKAEAERAAAHLNAYFSQEPLDDLRVSAEVILWPWPPASHADSVRFFYVETGIAPPDSEASAGEEHE